MPHYEFYCERCKKEVALNHGRTLAQIAEGQAAEVPRGRARVEKKGKA
jgi:hypothetical protein